MTNAETKYLEAALQEKRQELIGKISGRARDLDIGTGEPELIDRMQSMARRDEAAGMISRLSSTLAEVDGALRALSEGCYGVCNRCEEPIAVKRLQIIPWAAYCVRCQERYELAQRRLSAARIYRGEAA